MNFFTDAENTDEPVYATVMLENMKNPPNYDMIRNEAYVETVTMKQNVAYTTVQSLQVTEKSEDESEDIYY